MRFTHGKWPAIAGLLLLAGAACADESAPASVPHPALRFMMTGGITAGGDKIDEVHYTNGDSQNVRAGGNFYLGAGAIWQPSPDTPFTLQATINYHHGGVFASNGSADFERWPLELMAFYRPVENVRFGAGVRYVMSPKYSYNVDGGDSYSASFKNTLGSVIEVDYMFGDNALVGLRYVNEKYELKQSYPGEDTPKVNGSHVGLVGSYIF